MQGNGPTLGFVGLSNVMIQPGVFEMPKTLINRDLPIMLVFHAEVRTAVTVGQVPGNRAGVSLEKTAG